MGSAELDGYNRLSIKARCRTEARVPTFRLDWIRRKSWDTARLLVRVTRLALDSIGWPAVGVSRILGL